MTDSEKVPIRLGVVILAAGASLRMGRSKLLLRWGETSVIGHLLSQWRQTGAEQIGIVSAQANEAFTRELDRLKFPEDGRIINPSPEQGMFSSIQCAADSRHWNPALTHWAISLGDQPHLRQQTLLELLDFVVLNPRRICQPSRNGRPRHPVI
ncbi:MAG: NTP transferase domain-containing protein, partial [Verrucomicrobiales bacterium]|nr:NTP transferase domain-containing protein [Verrucomicrobiales bacterium]